MPVTIDFRANAAAFDAAVRQADRSLQRQEQQLEKLKAASGRMGDAQVRAIRKAEEAIKSQRGELNNLLNSQQKSAAHKARAAARAEQLNARQRRSLAEVGRAVRDVTQEERRLEREAAKTARAQEKAGKAGRQAFGSQAVSNLRSYVMGMVSITAAGAAIVRMMQEAKRIGEEAAQRARASKMGVGQLKQLSGGSQQKYDRLIGRVDALESMGLERETAGQVVFAAESAGFGEDTKLLGQMQAEGFIGNAQGMIQSVASVKSAFAGGDDTGSLKQMMGKALVASAATPVTADKLQDMLSEAAQGVGNLGFSDEEVLAGTAVASKTLREKSGIYMRQLLNRLGRLSAERTTATPEEQALAAVAESKQAEGLELTDDEQTALETMESLKIAREKLKGANLQGQSLVGMIETIDAAGFSDLELQKLLGNTRAVSAYRELASKPGEVTALKQQLDASQQQDIVGQYMSVTDDSQEATVRRQAAEGAVGVEDKRLGTLEDRAAELAARQSASMAELGYSPLARSLNAARTSVTDFVDREGMAERRAREFLFSAPEGSEYTTGYQEAIASIAENPEGYGIDDAEERRALREAVQQLVNLMPRQTELSERMADAAERLNATRQPTLVPAGEDR